MSAMAFAAEQEEDRISQHFLLHIRSTAEVITIHLFDAIRGSTMRSARLRLGLSLPFEFGPGPLSLLLRGAMQGRAGGLVMRRCLPHFLLSSVLLYSKSTRAVMHFGAKHTFSSLPPLKRTHKIL